MKPFQFEMLVMNTEKDVFLSMLFPNCSVLKFSFASDIGIINLNPENDVSLKCPLNSVLTNLKINLINDCLIQDKT